MNKSYYLLLLFVALIAFTSCEETAVVNEYDNWRPRNEAFIDSLQSVIDAKTDPDLFVVTPQVTTKYKIYAKKLKAISGDAQIPLYTDTVSVHYRVSLIDGTVVQQTYLNANPGDTDSPSSFAVTDEISGRTEVLQLMKLGERWLVYIPYQMAYGTVGQGSIPGYTTLIYDMQLMSITKPVPKKS